MIFLFDPRKSVKSLFFLLPLLGITNVLHFVWPNPLRGSWLSFAVWSITSHFLYSFQGVFVASVYFLFDDKVNRKPYRSTTSFFQQKSGGIKNPIDPIKSDRKCKFQSVKNCNLQKNSSKRHGFSLFLRPVPPYFR